jgi:hypothetical protein
MDKVVQLHGGPMHGQRVTVQEEWNHFHITEPPSPAALAFPSETPVPVRKGTYSQVAYQPRDFEWDGWK